MNNKEKKAKGRKAIQKKTIKEQQKAKIYRKTT